VTNSISQSYNWVDQTSSITPGGGGAINATLFGAGQGERLTSGSKGNVTNYEYDGTGLSSAINISGNPTAFTNTPDGEVVSENIPVGQPGCTRAGGAVSTDYSLHDGCGSTMALVESTGSVQIRYGVDLVWWAPWSQRTEGRYAPGDKAHGRHHVMLGHPGEGRYGLHTCSHPRYTSWASSRLAVPVCPPCPDHNGPRYGSFLQRVATPHTIAHSAVRLQHWPYNSRFASCQPVVSCPSCDYKKEHA